MTSIVRTYYSFQVPKTSDRTYKLELMGLWGWAELTIGIIVGCLPVMPKFIHHIAGQISRTFSPKSRDGVRAAYGQINRNEPSKANAITKIHGPFANHVGENMLESSTDMYSPHARLFGEYLTSDNFESLSLSAVKIYEPIHTPSIVISNRRDDLEYGETMI